MKFKEILNEAEQDNIARVRKQIKELERLNSHMRSNKEIIQQRILQGGSGKAAAVKMKKETNRRIRMNNEKIATLRKQIRSMRESHKMSIKKELEDPINIRWK
jgi:cob(I)alamin adenosyltransferase